MKRFFLFAVVNILILVVIMTIVSFFGLDTMYLKPNGLDIQALALISLLWGGLGSFISLLLSKRMAMWTFKIKLIKDPKSRGLGIKDSEQLASLSEESHYSQENFLFETVRSLASRANIKMPAVGIYASKEVNAFATGMSKNNSLIALSQGLLNEMTEDEIEGVLAHEMTHISNGDMVTMALLQGIMNAFVIFFSRLVAFAIQKTIGRDEQAIGGLSYFLITIVLQILFGILAGLVVNAFSRHREFKADNGGARLAGKRKMISALQKLQSLTNKIDTKQGSFATMKISDKPSKFLRVFATHPSLEDRIRALQEAMIS